VDLAFRPYAREDREAVLAICLAAFAPIHAGFEAALGPAIYALEFPDWRGDYARKIAAWPPPEPARAYIAEAGGSLVAFVESSVRAGGLGEIGLNAVAPDWQGRGIGRALYAFALEALRARGAMAATVGTGGDAAHAPARAAYAAVGFDRAIPSLHLYRRL
jgi:GNAT superfamily N-acetyltransferase